MELRQLKYFVKTAETLNFSEAAKALFVTQSTLSQQIRQLEQEIDTVLFVRDSHSVQLTESGERLLPLAEKTLKDATSCLDMVRDLKNMLSGSLNIGITYTFASILTQTVIAFTKAHPAIKLNIFYKTMEELMVMLEKRELDFVLSFKPSSVHPNIESHILFDNNLSVIVNKNHPLAKKEKVTLQDIMPYAVAIPSKALQARNEFDKLFPYAYNELKIRMELNEVNVLLDIVRESGLITILSEAVIHQIKGLVAIPFDVPENVMVGCVHTERSAYRKKATEEFIKMLQESDAVRERSTQWLK